MKKIILFFVIALSPLSVRGQWKKIADFPYYEYVTCVYFIDLPGPPRIGFAGTNMNLHKTTDGGVNWHTVCKGGVNDICFKDSLTGWFITDGPHYCYKTTDGGENWNALSSPETDPDVPGYAVYYIAPTNRLFVNIGNLIWVSTDLGNTWSDSLPYIGSSFSFSSPLKGIAAVDFYPDTTEGYIITSDGGLTWDTIHPQNSLNYINEAVVSNPFVIPGTQTCFGDDGGNYDIIRRSDDFGRTWRDVAIRFTDQYVTGIIRGDFSRLTIQTDSGMYVSVDSGATWRFDGGPSYITNFSNEDFYSAKGVTIAGMTYSDGGDEGGGLWEEIWPQSGVQQSSPITSQALLSAHLLENPMKDEIDVSYEMGRTALVTLELRDVLGRAVPIANAKYQLEQPGSHTASIPAPNLPPGVYYLRVTTDVGDAITLKIVKQ